MDPIASRYASGLRTYILTLKFADLEQAAHLLGPISYGGDCWEFRADLLRPASSSAAAVRRQLRVLQALPRRLPILFTVRTVSQGGRFPDDGARAALALMELAADAGCEYIDVEMSWPAFVLDGIRAAKGQAKLVASHHEFDSTVKWSSQAVRDLCAAASAVGDVVKLCVQAESIYDSLELGLFVRDYQERETKPIIAVAMGPHGQLSRFTAPVTFVTHALIPAPPGSDQLCLSDIHRARHLLGQLPRRRFGFSAGAQGAAADALLAPRFQAACDALGFPYSACRCRLGEASDDALFQSPDFGGAYVPDVGRTPLGALVRTTSAAAKNIGVADTVVVVEPAGPSNGNKAVLSADNTAWQALLACLQSSSDVVSSSSTALVLGAHPHVDANAAYYALQTFGIQDIYLVGLDAEDAASEVRTRFASLSTHMRVAGNASKAVEVLAQNASHTSLVVVLSGEHAFDDGLTRLLAPFSGVVLDVRTTAAGTAPAEARHSPPGQWTVYTAGDILQRQADVLFQIWTGRDAPVSAEPVPHL